MEMSTSSPSRTFQLLRRYACSPKHQPSATTWGRRLHHCGRHLPAVPSPALRSWPISPIRTLPAPPPPPWEPHSPKATLTPSHLHGHLCQKDCGKDVIGEGEEDALLQGTASTCCPPGPPFVSRGRSAHRRQQLSPVFDSGQWLPLSLRHTVSSSQNPPPSLSLPHTRSQRQPPTPLTLSSGQSAPCPGTALPPPNPVPRNGLEGETVPQQCCHLSLYLRPYPDSLLKIGAGLTLISDPPHPALHPSPRTCCPAVWPRNGATGQARGLGTGCPSLALCLRGGKEGDPRPLISVG